MRAKMMSLRGGERWLAVIGVVCFALLRLCAGDYIQESILCDDVEAICAHNGIENNVTECAKGERKFLNPRVCNCGVMCIENLKEGDSCYTSSLVTYPTKMCGPGLECKLLNPSDPESSICIKNPDKQCIKELLIYEGEQEQGTLGPGRNKPECDEFGYYSPRQCTPGNTCYCVNAEGKRLFGEELDTKGDINCKCSIYWEDIINKGLNLGMRCLSNGNFDSLQCIDSYCFCYNETADAVSYGPVSIDMIMFMPCYNSDIHFNWYTNPCHKAQEAWDNQGLDGDIIVAEVPKPVCSSDGYYAAVQYLRGNAYCADRDGNRIEDYELPIYLAGDMTCYCPRRRKLMEDNGYGANKPKCCDNGDYFPWQTRGLHSFCVDENGNQYGETATTTNIEDLSCYTHTPCPVTKVT